MANKKRGLNTVDTVWNLAQPIAQKLGLEIWDVRFQKEGANWFLRIFIDKDGGVGIEDCENMSRAINTPLDELDPIPQSYCLEVCSPGMDRELFREEHFKAYLGSTVKVKLIRPLENSTREIFGTLQNYKDNTVILKTDDGEISLAKKDTASVRLVEDDIVGGID